ncbi:uncharacterized protein METZ01_LOCUS426186, partial [marine metagenome]
GGFAGFGRGGVDFEEYQPPETDDFFAGFGDDPFGPGEVGGGGGYTTYSDGASDGGGFGGGRGDGFVDPFGGGRDDFGPEGGPGDQGGGDEYFAGFGDDGGMDV